MFYQKKQPLLSYHCPHTKRKNHPVLFSNQPSLGDSCVSPEVDSLKQSRQKNTRGRELDDSLMDVVADEDYDFIPGTPPHKKVKH